MMPPRRRYRPFGWAETLRAFCGALLAFWPWMLLSGSAVHGAGESPGAGEFQAYLLRHAQAGDIETTLAGLLPPGSEVVVDPKGNRLLVRGPFEAHQTVQKVLDSLDRAAAPAAAKAPAQPSQPILRVYACAAGEAAKTAADLQATLGNIAGVRIVADARTSQVLVYAPPEVQARVAEQLQQGQPATARPAAAPASAPDSASAPPVPRREIQLRHLTAAKLESALADMLGSRLVAVTTSAREAPQYRLTLGEGRWIGLAFNRRDDRVMIEGAGPGAESTVRLIQALDAPAASADERVRAIPLKGVRSADLQRTVDAIRTANGPRDQSARDASVPANGAEAPKAVAGLAAPEPKEPPREAAQAPAGREAMAPRADGQAPAAAAPAAEPKAEPPAKPDEEGGTLIGPVQVETLEGLDMLVIRGHRRDVEQVGEIIARIEELSAKTLPQIEIYLMQHVGCEAMAALVRPIYQEVFQPRQGTVSLTALVKPNALLVIGRPENVTTMLDLVKRLDQPVEPETQLRVFPLRHATASAAQTTVTEFYAQRAGLGPQVRVSADFRSNSLVVQASPRDMNEVALMIAKLDVPVNEAVDELRVFKLEHTLASELAPILQTAVTGQVGARAPGQPAVPTAQAGAQAAQQKSNMLRFVTIDARGQQRLESGILMDVRITADPRGNTLMVSAPAESMPLLEALIRQLDQPPALQAQIKVFTIVNADATTLADLLANLFGRPTGAAGAQPVAPGAVPTVVQTAAAAGESTLVQLRFATDVRTNSIIAAGTSGDLAVVEAILLRLDESDVRDRKTTVYRLKNSPADQVSTAINNFLRSERTLMQIAPGVLSPFEQIEREVVVVPEIVSNSLIVSATPRFFDEIKRIVEELDARPPMVMIQVLIAEVALRSVDEFGVELGLQDSILFDRGLLSNIQTLTETFTTAGGNQTTSQRIVSSEATPGFNFNNPNLPLGNNAGATNTRVVGSQGLSSLGVGRINSELGFGGLVLSASSESVSALIRALKQCQRLEVLSRPQVMTLDNQPAFIQVGQRVPRITSTQTTATGTINATVLENVGLILAVTPRISPDGLVVMEIDAENSKLGPESEGIPISININGDVIRSPRIDTSMAQTTVSAVSGQTVVLGGLLTKHKTKLTRRVPLLSDIPVVGNLFRYDMEDIKKNELLIIMTPHIVKTEEDAEKIKLAESARMDWCLADVVKLHGDSGLRGRRDEWLDDEVPVIYPDLNPAGQAQPRSPAGVPEVVPTPDAMPLPAVVPPASPPEASQPPRVLPQPGAAPADREPSMVRPPPKSDPAPVQPVQQSAYNPLRGS